MENIAVVIFLLTVVTVLAEITDKVNIPYPILLVLAGIGIGLIPGLPHIELEPDIVFLVFLPPILYEAAWNTSWANFKKARRPIFLLATGCVIFTAGLVALLAHTFIPYLDWPEALVLGAIISPPDAVAAAAATRGLAIPKRITTILEGESLVNDATGLIAYRYAIAFVATGTFGVWSAGLQFIIVALGGIVLGLAVGFLFKKIHQITPDNPTVDTAFTFLAPYVAYLSAEWFHLSGVLAVVAAGLFVSRSSSTVFSQQTRLNAYGSWGTVIFLLNGVIFILIGLQLPSILEGIQALSFDTLFYYGAIVSVAVILVRLIWVYPGSYIPRLLSKKIRRLEPEPDVRHVTIVGWSGMRGVVSLAAALALPLTIDGTDEPFPNRELIIFLTFSVIFSTLVIQGLTLRPLIRILGITSDGIEAKEETEARLLLASSVIEHIEENYALGLSDEVLNQIKTKYEIRIQRIRKDQEQRRMDDGQINEFHRIQQELLDKERSVILGLRSAGKVSDEVMRKIEYELDLEETRLILERGAA
jgi:CPA1 family monovalent cation:H+ antiporter